MDRAKLKQELGRPEYAGLDAEQIRAALYAVDRPTRRLVPLWRVKRALVASQTETSTSVEQLRRAGRRAAGVAREIADKLGLSEQAKTSLREVEEELAD